MPLYSGTLKELGQGERIAAGTGRFTTRFGWGGTLAMTSEQKNPLGGWTQRMFVDVGDARIRHVLIRPIHEALLQSALGQEISLSLSRFGATHRVEAIRTPRDGVVKASLPLMMAGMVARIVRTVIALVGLTLFGALAVVLTGAIAGNTAEVVAVAVCAFLAIVVLWGAGAGLVKTWIAWARL